MSRLNPRLAKIHRSYRVDEIAQLYQVHRNTVRNWIKKGLPTIQGIRPFLVRGLDLGRFLSDRRQKARQLCPAGHVYCVRCRAPKAPAGGVADYIPLGPRWGSLVGICPDCEILIYRHVSLGRLDAVAGPLEITFQRAPGHITEMGAPS